MRLNKEEKELLAAFENGEFKRAKNVKKEIAKAKAAAKNYLRKEARINIRLSSADLSMLKRRAAEKGLPYQSLISSLLHQYATGHINDSL